MKRLIAIFMIFSTVILTACGRKTSAHDQKSTSDDTAYQNSESFSYDDKGSIDTISTSTESPYSSIASGMYNLPKTYDIGDEDENANENDFVNWCKVMIEDYSEDDIYEDNTKFLTYLRSNGKITIPHMRNKIFRFQRATVPYDKYKFGCCYFVWYMTEDYRRFMFQMHPISELSNYTSLEQYVNETDGVDRVINRGDCRYGEYFLCGLETDSEETCIIYFVVDDFMVRVILNKMEWSPDYFDYFYFETVSLK